MSILTVRHATVYRYREPVIFGEHRMMFRPRESHDLRLIGINLAITPQPTRLRWLHDPFDNSVTIATFDGPASELNFESTVHLEHFESTLPEYPLEEYAHQYPFRYADEDLPNLMRALDRQYPGERVDKWALQFLDSAVATETMKMLRAMTHGIREQIRYNRRAEKGVQTPEETLQIGRGSCRDFAVLMMDAARSLGIAARFVSGYIFIPDSSGLAGGGATHAWMQAYLPGAGWVDFDPTNNLTPALEHIILAWGRDFGDVSPLRGVILGGGSHDPEVSVTVMPLEEALARGV